MEYLKISLYLRSLYLEETTQKKKLLKNDIMDNNQSTADRAADEVYGVTLGEKVHRNLTGVGDWLKTKKGQKGGYHRFSHVINDDGEWARIDQKLKVRNPIYDGFTKDAITLTGAIRDGTVVRTAAEMLDRYEEAGTVDDLLCAAFVSLCLDKYPNILLDNCDKDPADAFEFWWMPLLSDDAPTSVLEMIEQVARASALERAEMWSRLEAIHPPADPPSR